MPFRASTLSSDQLTRLRGTSSAAPKFSGAVYVSYVPNEIVCQVAVTQSSFAASFATIDVGTPTIGALTDILPGMTILISPTTDLRGAYFTGRARVVPSGNTVRVNETSAPVANGHVLTVLDDYRISDRLPRQVGNQTQVDYDYGFIQPRPFVYGLQSAYVAYTTGSSASFSFAPQTVAGTSGASISVHTWSVADGTITTGTAASQNVTVSFPIGFRWISYTVIDSSLSRNTTRRIPVWVHDDSTFPAQLLTVGNVQVTADVDNGYNATLTAFDGVDSLLDGTLMVISTVDTYQASADPFTHNIAFMGRMRQDSSVSTADPVTALTTEARITLEGAQAQLARLQCVPFEILDDASPLAWGEITSCTVWRAIHFILSELSNFDTLHDIRFDSFAETYRARGFVVEGGNILAAVNNIAGSINAAVQTNGAGQLEIVRDARMLDTADRSSLVTVANWTTADILEFTLNHAHGLIIGKVDASGGSYNSYSSTVTPVLSRAPGVAQESADGTAALDGQVLQVNASQSDVQDELNVRSGHAFAKAQQADTLEVVHPDGYHWLTPARDQWYTFTLASTDSARGIALTTSIRWLLVGIDITHNVEDGTKAVRATYTRETSGAPGATVQYPEPTSTLDLTPPAFPPFDLFPAFPAPLDFSGAVTPPPYTGAPGSQPAAPVPSNGNTAMAWTTAALYRTTTLLQTRPVWTDITPAIDSGWTLKAAAFKTASRGAVVLAAGSTTSAVWRTSDVFANPVAWTRGATISGVYTVLRTDASTEDVFIYSPDTSGAGWTQTYDFTASNGSFANTDYLSPIISVGSWSSGNGWVDGSFTYGGANGTGLTASRTFTSTTITSFTATYTFTPGTGQVYAEASLLSSGSVVASATGATSAGTHTISWTGSVTADTLIFDGQCSYDPDGGSCTLTDLSVTGAGSNPFGGGGGGTGAQVAFSSDAGATFGTGLAVGTALSYGGFDVIKVGAASLAARSGQVERATTAGGAYTNYGSAFPTTGVPSALHIPRYQFGSTTVGNTSTNTPQYLVGSSGLAASGESLWKVTGSGTTFTAITPVDGANKGLIVDPNGLTAAYKSGNVLAAIMSFAGTRKIARSINAGTAWVFSAAVSSAAQYLVMRRNDTTNKQAFFANGTNGVGYIANIQATTPVIVSKPLPSASACTGVAVYAG